ncbi:MAG: DegT/DnrJ/EryC1/StrS family aminotransferase [Acidobacteriota bacterium]|nr:DegT/DnrJ/EryC1/StrS family aminotransferase [Blastocatellia bacterium]MDW8240511.1 DegT/DnrJ/EryC1/StrS family aminotransferase [Acidobacteriota bacterium]
MRAQSSSISFFHSHISPRAIELVTEVLHSGWVNEGEMVRRFEASLTDVLGLRHPVTVNSGTSALHLALALSGVRPGDEVILPAQTFVATGLVVLMQGATPVFADIDPLTGVISPESIAEKITPRTRAVIPVHWGGYPCDLDEIHAIAAAHELSVIEDAAHALGATYKGRPIGAISRFTAFSFQAIKHLTTGDGGALCCQNEEDAKAAVARRWFGMDRAARQPSLLGARGIDIKTLGYKYHMNNVAAAIGLGNLEDFPARLARRRQIAAFYRSELEHCAGLQLLQLKPDREHAYWLFTLLVDRREDFVRRLAERGIPTSVVDLRIDQNSVFGGPRALPGQAEFDQRQISIPLHENLSDSQVEWIVEAIKEVAG